MVSCAWVHATGHAEGPGRRPSLHSAGSWVFVVAGGPISRTPNTPDGVAAIARDLTGDLRCLRCGYNLRGLSIRASCPECSLPVKATILAIVDPKAAELRPLHAPRLLANALVLWAAGPLLAALCVWWLRADEVLSHFWPWFAAPAWLPVLATLAIASSGLAALVLVRPHARIPLWRSASAVLGVALFIPLILTFYHLHARVDTLYPAPYVGRTADERPLLRIAIALLSSSILILLRPNARAVSMRSFLVRTGRVDRQSMLALAGAFLLGASGDAISLLIATLPSAARDIGLVSRIALIALASVLITLGLVNMFLDTLRLRPVLASNGLGLADILETNRQRDTRLAAPPKNTTP